MILDDGQYGGKVGVGKGGHPNRKSAVIVEIENENEDGDETDHLKGIKLKMQEIVGTLAGLVGQDFTEASERLVQKEEGLKQLFASVSPTK